MKRESKQFWEDMRWGRNHHSQLLKKYRDKWVAIFRNKVVASGKILAEVQKKAKQATGNEIVAVKFIECGAHIYAFKD